MATTGSSSTIDREELDALFGVLERRGYTVVGPTVRDRAIVLEEIDSTEQLPAGSSRGDYTQPCGKTPMAYGRRRHSVALRHH